MPSRNTFNYDFEIHSLHAVVVANRNSGCQENGDLNVCQPNLLLCEENEI